MYRLGERRESHRGFYIWLGVILTIIIGGGAASLLLLHPDAKVSKTPAAVVRKITYDDGATITYNEPTFSITLPNDWKVEPVNDQPAPTYTWHGTNKDNTDRWIDVFVDAIPATLAVNRVVHVQANGGAISVISDVSDNCTTFGNAPNQSSGVAQTKWEGLSFLCDTGNYTRDVVGTVSPDGINQVSLTGATGTHHFFFTYTDNSYTPNYQIFTKALKSVIAK